MQVRTYLSVPGGYIQYNPAGTGTGQVWRGGGGPKRWSSSGWTWGPFYPQRGGHPVPPRPLVRPDPGLFLRMFQEGEIYLEGDAVVQVGLSSACGLS